MYGAFQARVNGCKGLLMFMNDYEIFCAFLSDFKILGLSNLICGHFTFKLVLRWRQVEFELKGVKGRLMKSQTV
jgi:hypothetical protein